MEALNRKERYYTLSFTVTNIFQLAQTCVGNALLCHFRPEAYQYLDMVSFLHAQLRLKDNFYRNRGSVTVMEEFI